MQLAPLDNNVVKATNLIAADTITASERAAIMDEREWQDRIEKERNARSIEIARSMVTEGMDVAFIIRMTGLSETEVLALQKEIS